MRFMVWRVEFLRQWNWEQHRRKKKTDRRLKVKCFTFFIPFSRRRERHFRRWWRISAVCRIVMLVISKKRDYMVGYIDYSCMYWAVSLTSALIHSSLFRFLHFLTFSSLGKGRGESWPNLWWLQTRSINSTIYIPLNSTHSHLSLPVRPISKISWVYDWCSICPMVSGSLWPTESRRIDDDGIRELFFCYAK